MEIFLSFLKNFFESSPNLVNNNFLSLLEQNSSFEEFIKDKDLVKEILISVSDMPSAEISSAQNDSADGPGISSIAIRN
jgi:hypothetical protein